MTGIFWNGKEHRLRVGWRLVGAGLLTAILTFLLGAPFMAAGGFPAPYVAKMVLYVAAVVAIWLATRQLDRRPWADTGIYWQRGWWVDLGFGLLLGACLMTMIFLVELWAGWVTIRALFEPGDAGRPFLAAIGWPLLLAVMVGVGEELMFRGYLLLNLAEGLNGRAVGPGWALLLAWLLTAAIFGVAHAFLPNATVVSTLNIVLAGIWMGLPYVLTGSLAASIGVHSSWNFFQGHVYGFPISGGRDFAATVIAIGQDGPALWTGGAFGPEGGLLGLFAFVVGIVLMAGWVRRRTGGWTLNTAIAQPPSVG